MTMPSIVAMTNSITNMPEPVVGMGATQYMIADKYPYTVTKIVSPKKIEVKPNSHRADPDKPGGPGYQNWIIDEEPNHDAAPYVLTKRKNGWWIPVGEDMKTGRRFEVGRRGYYHSWEY